LQKNIQIFPKKVKHSLMFRQILYKLRQTSFQMLKIKFKQEKKKSCLKEKHSQKKRGRAEEM